MEAYELRKLIFESRKASSILADFLGVFYGYPRCCINEFCNDIINDRFPNRSIDGSGFVPCKKHYEQIRKGELNLSDLIKNRVCKEEFNQPPQ